MNILSKLTLKNLKLNKKRTIVTCMGIILSTALICAVAGMVTSFQGTLVDSSIKFDGKYHTRFEGVSSEDLKYFSKNKSIESYFLTQNIGYTKINSENKYKPYIFLMGFDDDALKNSGLTIESGRMPENANEIVIPSHLISDGNVVLKVGDTIKITPSNRVVNGNVLTQSDPYDTDIPEELVPLANEKEYKIVGIVSRPSIESYSSAGYTIITKIDNPSTYNVSVYYKNPKNYKTFAKDICGVQNVKDCKYKVINNNELLRWQGASLSDNTLNILYSVGAIIILIILVTSVFVIRNSFSISIIERLKQYGMLSSVGATKKQIRKNVLFEGLILGLISIPLGILLGILAIVILLALVNLILKDYLNGIKFIYYVPFFAIIISVLVSAITIYFSTLASAHKAAKISPIEAIRSNSEINIKSKKLKTPKIIKKLFGIGGEISYKNLKRSRKKYRTTVISLVVSIAIFIGLSSFINYGFKISSSQYKTINYDINFLNSSDETTKKIIALDGIENYASYKTLSGTISADYYSEFGKNYLKNVSGDNSEINADAQIIIAGMNNESYKKYVASLGLNYDEIKDKGILLNITNSYKENNVKKEGQLLNVKSGDNLKFKYEASEGNITIGATTDKTPIGYEFSNGTYSIIIVNQDIIKNYTKENISSSLYIKINDYQKFKGELRDLQNNDTAVKSLYVNDIREFEKEMNAMVLVISIFLYGFIAVITLIGVTNIFNTITTNMNLRSKEFAMLKSIGMTGKEFNHMIRLESIFYGTKSLIIGIPIGIILSYLIYKAFNETTTFILPIEAIIISIIFVFIIVGLTMYYSLRKINKQNIIETIRNDNI
jgi:putative ABC transport system permease protein